MLSLLFAGVFFGYVGTANFNESGHTSFASRGFTYIQQCAKIFRGEPQEGPVKYRPAPKSSKRKLSEMETVKLAAFNLQEFAFRNVVDANGKTKSEFGKSERKVKGVAEQIKRVNPDVMVVTEVGSSGLLDVMDKRYLNEQYDSVVIKGNDERGGINIGFMIKKDLPINFEVKSHKNMYETSPKGQYQVFTRDLPVMVATVEGREKPLFILIGTHYISQRGRDGNAWKRNTQAKATAEIKKLYQEKYGPDVLIMLAGDLNSHVPTANEFKPLWESGFQDAFDLAPNNLSNDDRVTHTTFNKEERRLSFSQLDAFLLSNVKNAKSLIKKTRAVPYYDSGDRPMSLDLPKEVRLQQASDHRLIELELYLQGLLN